MRKVFTEVEMERFRVLALQIKAGDYQLPIEGQLLKPAGIERHTKGNPAEAE